MEKIFEKRGWLSKVSKVLGKAALQKMCYSTCDIYRFIWATVSHRNDVTTKGQMQ